MFIGEVMQQTSEYGRKLIAGLSGEVGGLSTQLLCEIVG